MVLRELGYGGVERGVEFIYQLLMGRLGRSSDERGGTLFGRHVDEEVSTA